MRKVLVSLIAAGVAASAVSAIAQETTTEAPVPAPEAAAPPVASDVVITPAPETIVTPSGPVTIITPPPSEADVAVEPEPEPAPPPPPPPPTDPVTIAVLNAVESICKPLVKGGDIKALSAPLGYKKRKESYVLTVAKPFQVTVLPQGSNKNVCQLEIDYGVDQVEPIVVGVHNWAMARGWTLYRNDVYNTDMKRHTRSWELAGDVETEALVLVALKKTDGTPLARNADRATVLYSVTPTPPATQ